MSPHAPDQFPHNGPVWTIVVAAGSGRRFGAAKQFVMLGDERVVDASVRVALASSDGVVLVVPAADVDDEQARLRELVGVVAGGGTRSESVRRGLAAVPSAAAVICIHDGARPFADTALYQAVVAAVRAGADAAVPAVSVTDTIKLVDDDGRVVHTPPRDRLVAVQTPQAFRADALRSAHATGGDGTDDAVLIETAGGTVRVVPGSDRNRKITTPDDLVWARGQIGTA